MPNNAGQETQPIVMDRVKQYTAAIEAYENGDYVLATDLYMELIRQDRAYVFNLISSNYVAKKNHILLAFEHAYQKILFQHVKKQNLRRIDLSFFSQNTDVQIVYDESISEFIKQWKKSEAFTTYRDEGFSHYAELYRKYFPSMKPEDVDAAGIYAATWVYLDFLDLESILPKAPKSILNLGCGAGMFDIIYMKSLEYEAQAILVDTNESMAQPISRLAELNDVPRIEFKSQVDEFSPLPDFVFSIRSCGYLYDVNEYVHVFEQLKQGTRVFLDVTRDRIPSTVEYFASLGATHTLHPRSQADVKLVEFSY